MTPVFKSAFESEMAAAQQLLWVSGDATVVTIEGFCPADSMQ